jgi:peroxiredoxin
MQVALLISRLLLAAVFVASGIAKLFDFPGSRKSMRDFGVPAFLAAPVAGLLPLAELIFAVLLLLDRWAWWGAAGVAALLALFIVGIGVNLARGRKPNCHCFGQLSSTPVGWTTLVRNFALLALGLLVLSRNPESVGGWSQLPQLTAFEIVQLSLAAAVLLLSGFTVWLLFQMLAQNGRLLLRLEAMEKKLKVDPDKPEVPGVPVGEAAPSFELANLAGETVSRESLGKSGLPLLLVFAEPGCGACEELQPKLAEWQREHSERLTVVPVSRGHVEANLDRGKRYGVTGTLMQKDREVWNAYQVTATPSAVLIKDGKIDSPLAAGPDAIGDLVRRSTLPPPAKKGDPLPALKLPDLDGKTVDLSALRGRRTMLLFWNPGCGFCQQMLDDVKKWEQSPPKNAPDLLVISSGTPEANRKQGFRSRVLLDSIWGAGNVLGAGGTPSAVLVDEEGTVASEVSVGKPAVLALAGVPPDV